MGEWRGPRTHREQIEHERGSSKECRDRKTDRTGFEDRYKQKDDMCRGKVHSDLTDN